MMSECGDWKVGLGGFGLLGVLRLGSFWLAFCVFFGLFAFSSGSPGLL